MMWKIWRRGGMDAADCMRRAIEIAYLGKGSVHPNPLVGCVLVKDGEIIAEGWHGHLGGLHAEQAAIADAEEKGVSTSGCTAYVTLEPCNHHGRTPPCTEALLWAGVEKVVIGALDPNPTVRGGGMKALEEQGINVESGLMEEDCVLQMRPFMHWCKERRPLVLLKAALDSDGRVDVDDSSPSERFTSDSSLKWAHKIRSEHMAILVGVETVVRDDPELTARGVDARIQPIRVIIDPNARIPENSKVLCDGLAPTILIHSKPVLSEDMAHVTRYVVPSENREIEVEKILDLLGDLRIQSLIVEGGPLTWKRFLKADVVDDAVLIRSQINLSSGESNAFGESYLLEAGMEQISQEDCGGDIMTVWSRHR
jgi:diaminohydroxyphosphoribosylaminopyrimidine deaminase/5-amino-6-(5-phosphoribosylamino)uracil reductase|tara:strand:+ start:1224 stop:2327 length:1104 start_codon:yes stop_codon:yes gene_type:complete